MLSWSPLLARSILYSSDSCSNSSSTTTTRVLSSSLRHVKSRRLFSSHPLYLLVVSLLPCASRAFSSRSSGGWSGYNSMATFVTERTSDGTIIVSPKKESDQSALIVISHGLGDSAEGFVDVAERLATKLPWIKFILPTAPMQPVTLNGGMRMNSWYDIVGLDERSNENCAGIEDTSARLAQILQTEHDTTELPFRRMILAGFSQGGALSLYTGLQLASSDHKLAAIVCLSGYLPAASKVKITPGLEDTPVWHGHGTGDMLVAYALAERSKQYLSNKGHVGDYTIESYPIGHTVSEKEVADVETFLRKVLPQDDTCRIQLKDPSTMSVKELRQAIRKAGLSKEAIGFTEKSEFVKLLQKNRD